MNNLISNYMGFDGRLNRQRWWIAAILDALDETQSTRLNIGRDHV
jgi:hypothetical protein